VNALLKTGLAAAIAIALASLGGCGAKPASAEAGPAMPVIKAGLWSVRVTKDGKRGEAEESCVSEPSVEKLVTGWPMLGKSCSKSQVKLEDGVVVGRFTCKQGKAKLTTVVKVTGDFKKNYQMEAHQAVAPLPRKGSGQSIVMLGAERLGECPK
jgi:hypothetical protein